MKNLWLGWVCILNFLGNGCKQEYLSSGGGMPILKAINFTFVDSLSGKDLFLGDYATLSVDSLTFNGKKSGDYDYIKDLYDKYGYYLNYNMVVMYSNGFLPFLDSLGTNFERISFSIRGYPSTWDNEEYVLRVEYNNNLLGTLKARFRILSTRERKKYPSYSRCIERNFYSHPSECDEFIELLFNDEVICSGCDLFTVHEIKI